MKITDEMMDFAVIAYSIIRKRRDCIFKEARIEKIIESDFSGVYACLHVHTNNRLSSTVWVLHHSRSSLDYWSYRKGGRVRVRWDHWQEDILRAEDLTAFDFLMDGVNNGLT